MFRLINQSLHPTGCISLILLFYVFGDSYASGTQDEEVTKSLLIVPLEYFAIKLRELTALIVYTDQ